MHDALYQRLVRKIESLPDEQIYQVLDFIEFLESKYSQTAPVEASGLQKFAENLEDKLRKKAVSPNTIREAFQLITAADRVVSSVSEKGRRMLSDLSTAFDASSDERGSGEGRAGRGDAGEETSRPAAEDPGPGKAGRGEGDPRPSQAGGAAEAPEGRPAGEVEEDDAEPGSGDDTPPTEAPEERR